MNSNAPRPSLPVTLHTEAREIEPNVFHLATFVSPPEAQLAQKELGVAFPQSGHLLMDMREGQLVMTTTCGCHVTLSLSNMLAQLQKMVVDSHGAGQAKTH